MSEIEILGKIQNYLKVFKSIDEFNLYYAKNKEEMDNMTTQKLNKLYLINVSDDGNKKYIKYKITRKETRDETGKHQKGVLCLKQDTTKYKEENYVNEMKQFDESINDLKMKIEDMMMKINKIGGILQTHQTSINNLIKNYNSLIENDDCETSLN